MFGEVHEGDVLEVLRGTPDATYHGCLTDPPYGLSFMGHGWDHGVPSADVWREVLRVMKPGAHLLAFGGTRTFHRLTCAIEDAGFEVRDVIAWMYGSGFPKSHNGPWGGTALKPAYEPILVARRPLEGTVAANVQRWGCGGLAIDACRVGTAKRSPEFRATLGKVEGPGSLSGVKTPRANVDASVGRWPANVILDEEAGAALDAQSGERPGMSGGGKHKPGSKGGMFGAIDCTHTARNDSGGASRFFYCAKASRAERNAGCGALPYRWEPGDEPRSNRSGETRPIHGTNSTSGNTTANRGNIHPTVKPLALARYLARLILPPVEGARLVVPFCGSGSEVIGAMQAGWSHVEGIDSWDVAVRIARARIAHHTADHQLELARVGT